MVGKNKTQNINIIISKLKNDNHSFHFAFFRYTIIVDFEHICNRYSWRKHFSNGDFSRTVFVFSFVTTKNHNNSIQYILFFTILNIVQKQSLNTRNIPKKRKIHFINKFNLIKIIYEIFLIGISSAMI